MRDDAGSHENDAVYDAVMSNLYSAVVKLGQASNARAKPVPGVAPKPWDALSSLQKLNAISEATQVSVKTWVDSIQPGAEKPIGPLQLSVLAAASQKS